MADWVYTICHNQSNQSSSGYEGLQKCGGLLRWIVFDYCGYLGQDMISPYTTPIIHLIATLCGPSQFRPRAGHSVGHVWDLPFGPDKKYLNGKGANRHLVGGWEWSGDFALDVW